MLAHHKESSNKDKYEKCAVGIGKFNEPTREHARKHARDHTARDHTASYRQD